MRTKAYVWLLSNHDSQMRTEGIILVERKHNNASGVLYTQWNYPSRVKAKTKDKHNLADVFYFFKKNYMLKYVHYREKRLKIINLDLHGEKIHRIKNLSK